MSDTTAPPEPLAPAPQPGEAVAASAPEPQDSAELRDDVEALVLDALAEGPATSHEIARRLDALWPHGLGAREGYLLPLLLELRRAGRVRAAWADRPDGRRRVYEDARSGGPAAPPDASIAPDRATGSAQLRRLPSRAVRRFADAATSKLAFAPRLAEEARVELAAHVMDLLEARLRAGEPVDAAEQEAIHALGDPWKIATDLSRAARGRRTVIFPRTGGESLLSLVLYDAGILVAILLTILFVRAQVVAAYHIPTKSMEPTLHGARDGGDRILVLRLAPPPGRFDIEVFEGWLKDRKQYVKRCVGLPGEDVRIHAGDLWIDGRLVRKEGADVDAMLFPLYARDVEEEAAEREGEVFTERVKARWDWDDEGRWEIWDDGDFETLPEPEGSTHVLRFRQTLSDALYEDGELDEGITEVSDGRLTVDVTPSAGSRLLLRWTRGAERYDAVLRGEQPGVALLVDGVEVARRADVALPTRDATRVRFSYVDRVLRLEVDGEPVLRHDLPEPSVPRRTGPGAEVSIHAFDGRVRVRPVSLERDVHWTSEYETTPRARLGPDEYFMLGDNSSNSQDSRSRGAVHRSRLVGKPLLIVWPLRRFRIPR
jgi:signal peptidase I